MKTVCTKCLQKSLAIKASESVLIEKLDKPDRTFTTNAQF